MFDLNVFPCCTSFSSFILQQTYPPFIRRKLVDFAFVFEHEINDLDPWAPAFSKNGIPDEILEWTTFAFRTLDCKFRGHFLYTPLYTWFLSLKWKWTVLHPDRRKMKLVELFMKGSGHLPINYLYLALLYMNSSSSKTKYCTYVFLEVLGSIRMKDTVHGTS